MAKRPTKRTAITKARGSSLPGGLISAEPMEYPVAGTSITALQLYHNPDRKPSVDGPWSNEADKVAWVDEETGLGCIMLRQEDGTISGYVGVGPEHPLFGFEADAVPVEISNLVHGGVTYGKACEVNRFERVAWGKPREERYTVCHVTHIRLVQEYRTVQSTKDEFHEDLWWLGFDTNHPGDLIPNDRGERYKGEVYRDQGFVYANCIVLARKLKSVRDAANASPEASTFEGLLPPPSNGAGEKR